MKNRIHFGKNVSKSQTQGELSNLDIHPSFPVNDEGWKHCKVLPSPRTTNTMLNPKLSLLVNPQAFKPVSATLREMVAKYPREFAKASRLFKPCEWRQLYLVDQYPISNLGQPDFDPENAFRCILEKDTDFLIVPVEWTGTPQSSIEDLIELEILIRQADMESLSFAYAILTLARSIGFELPDVRQVPFWDSSWIKRYLAYSEEHFE